jgi:transmembrane sensor
MDINTNFSRDVDNLLQNEEFIKWRLFRTEELEEYWENFRKENPHNEDVLQEAISRFEAVKINYYPISDTEKKDIFGEVTYRIKQHKRHLWMLRAGSVAAVLVMGLLSVIFVKEMKNNARHAIPDNPAMIVGKTLPEEEICLITAGKKNPITP